MVCAYETERAYLRTLEPKDAAAIFEVFNDAEILNGFMRSSLAALPRSREQVTKLVQRFIDSKNEFFLVIEEKGTNNFIGLVNVMPDYISRISHISIFIANNFRNKKFGYEVLNFIIDLIFSTMNMKEIALVVYSFNKSAIRLYEKLGFVTEAVLKGHVFRDGEYYDEVFMHLTREMYNKNQS